MKKILLIICGMALIFMTFMLPAVGTTEPNEPAQVTESNDVVINVIDIDNAKVSIPISYTRHQLLDRKHGLKDEIQTYRNEIKILERELERINIILTKMDDANEVRK